MAPYVDNYPHKVLEAASRRTVPTSLRKPSINSWTVQT
jgi:hypothetical protein